MRLLSAGVDTTVIALWLGHEQVATTQTYIHADLALKEQALARTTPAGTTPGRYRHQTRSSPSSKACDYADLPGPVTPNSSATAHHLGITVTSA
jgi:hypothetical protein